jgi:hypothetical protein
MNTLTSRVQRLRLKLRQEIAGGGPPRSQFDQLRDQIVDLVLRALRDDNHPCAKHLIELQKWIELHREVPAIEPDRKDSSQPDPKTETEQVLVLSEKHLFMPQPGNGSVKIRSFWSLQLLLYIVARSNRLEELAVHLKMGGEAVKSAVDVSTKDAVDPTRPAGVWLWSTNQFWEYVQLALEQLEHSDPPPEIRLHGKILYYNNIGLTLTPMCARFLQQLLNSPNKPISRKAFNDAGVPNPTKIKGDLVNHLKKNGIYLPIMSPPNAYVLVLETS